MGKSLRLLVSSDIIESVFGRAKNMHAGEIKDPYTLAMRIPGFLGDTDATLEPLDCAELSAVKAALPSVARDRRRLKKGLLSLNEAKAQDTSLHILPGRLEVDGEIIVTRDLTSMIQNQNSLPPIGTPNSPVELPESSVAAPLQENAKSKDDDDDKAILKQESHEGHSPCQQEECLATPKAPTLTKSREQHQQDVIPSPISAEGPPKAIARSALSQAATICLNPKNLISPPDGMVYQAMADPAVTVKNPQIGLHAQILASKRKVPLVRDRSGRFVINPEPATLAAVMAG
jgi:hypothetical protein